MTKLLELTCLDYCFDDNLELTKVSQCIDVVLLANFENKKVVLRGIQSAKHSLSKQKLLRYIIDTGSDRYELASTEEVKVSNKSIDLFGYACAIKKPPIALPVLEGFHKYKPKSLERPQRKVDIWMLYNASQLENVEYDHARYGVLAKDGYVFKNAHYKKDALLGVLVIR